MKTNTASFPFIFKKPFDEDFRQMQNLLIQSSEGYFHVIKKQKLKFTPQTPVWTLYKVCNLLSIMNK